MKKLKGVVLTASVVLLAGVAIGGTISWLVAQTDPVVNTFTSGNIQISLDETKTDHLGNYVDQSGKLLFDRVNNQTGDAVPDGLPDKTKTGNTYQMMPGRTFYKDPEVTVKAGSEKMWLFVKIEEKNNAQEFLAYSTDNCWQPVVNGTAVVKNVYYCIVQPSAADVVVPVLENNKVKVKEDVDQSKLAQVQNAAEKPTLNITAYAIQYEGFECEDVLDKDKRDAAAYTAWVTAAAGGV